MYLAFDFLAKDNAFHTKLSASHSSMEKIFSKLIIRFGKILHIFKISTNVLFSLFNHKSTKVLLALFNHKKSFHAIFSIHC